MNQVVAKDDATLPPKTAMLATGGAVRAIVPQTLDDIYRLSNVIIKSGMAPKDFKTPEACTVAIMHGMEIGLKPFQALQRIAVINGRPTLWGDAMLGLCQASGLLDDIAESFEGKGDDYGAVCIVKRKGRATPVVGTFTIGDSRRAKLFGKSGPHTDYRDRMLKMRARAFALRDAFADVLGGMYSAEEAMDMDDMKDITPSPRPERKDFIIPVQNNPQGHGDNNTAQQEQGNAAAEPTEQVDEDGVVTTAEYGPPEAKADGALARAEGKAVTDMPVHIKSFPELREAWEYGFENAPE